MNSVNSLFGNIFEMPPPKSKVWTYFERTFCSNSVISKGGNTTNLVVHLRRSLKIDCALTHPWQVCKCVISFIFNRNLRYHMVYRISIILYQYKLQISYRSSWPIHSPSIDSVLWMFIGNPLFLEATLTRDHLLACVSRTRLYDAHLPIKYCRLD